MKHFKSVCVASFVFASLWMGCEAVADTKPSIKAPFFGYIAEIETPAVKNFEILGLVFCEVVENNTGNGERITYNALLKEAAKLNGHNIMNARLDIKREENRTIWYGSALAIRYTETVRAGVLDDKERIPTADSITLPKP